MNHNRSNDGPKTASDLMGELLRDPEYTTKRNLRERERRSLANNNALAAAPLLADLEAAGFPVKAVADLFNCKLQYKAAIPLLLAWLPRVTEPLVKQDVIRALTVRWAKSVAASPLIKELRKAANNGDLNLAWAIANALAVVADDSVLDDLIVVVHDPEFGKAREMLVLALANMQDPRAIKILIDLLGDEQVAGHAVMALGKLKAKAARRAIQALLNHPKPWVRKEARKSLAKIDKT